MGQARPVQRLSELRDRVEKIDLATTEVGSAESRHREETAECGRLEANVRELTQQVGKRDQQITTLRASAQRADFLSLSEHRLDGLLQNRQRLDQVNAGLDSARMRNSSGVWYRCPTVTRSVVTNRSPQHDREH